MPLRRDRYKIYILDEAHQITEAAFNALLKTLEEPPAHVIFMMATTEPENIPQTIRSRCQHFSFHAVKFDDILAQLKMIAGRSRWSRRGSTGPAGRSRRRLDARRALDHGPGHCVGPGGGGPAGAVSGADSRADGLGAQRRFRAAAGSRGRRPERGVDGTAEPAGQCGAQPFVAGAADGSLSAQRADGKLGGEQTELLQISGDERARAARTALLFTEEELTRNLQIVLRTFDDLNYRQEQRFHLELGLLKLIHAQRLLPLEELLSGVSAGGAVVRQAGAIGTPRSSPAPSRPAPPAAPPTAPSISPFGSSGGGWSKGAGSGGPKLDAGPKAESAGGPVATMERPSSVVSQAVADEAAGSPFQGSTPFPAAASLAVGFASAAALTEGALAKAPEAVAPASGAPSMEAVRQAIVSALTDADHTSAAQLLGTGAWTLDGASLRIEVPGMGKKMLALTVNAAAEKIIRQELQRLGAPSRFLVVPGEGSTGAAQAAPVTAPVAGSIQEAALGNPLVQRAQEIFKAEVRSVLDLRPK
jgi:DNA polymerase-3 subunit gamma/tau